MCVRSASRLLAFACVSLVLLSIASAALPAQGAPTQSGAVSFWGMNAYLTKRERIGTGDNLGALAAMARDAGVRWTREELPWDLIEPQNNNFKPVYDGSLKQTADQGFDIIGMLLTTPAWARDGACAGSYFCPPANVAEYAQFAAWMVERYDGDGNADAPGSPRIAAWEIWNEPNAAATWPVLGPGGTVSQRRYGDMLVAAYQAIKAADPSALVLTGGVYVYDGSYCDPNNCDGLRWLNGVVAQVPAARQAFDVLSIHPYIPTERPDAPNIPRLITVEGRVRSARAWVERNGRAGAPVWITEMGWCTASGACPGGVQVSEEQQANYLVRSLVIAQQNGVAHGSWFQLEDAFNNSNREWSNAAIVRNWDGAGYPAKPAYFAYRTLAGQIGDAVPNGPGPVHTHVYDPSQPYVGSGGTYDYRYTRGGTTIDVLWRPTDAVTVAFPVIPGRAVTLVNRDGSATPLSPANGVVRLSLSERPILVVQGEAAPRLVVAQSPLTVLVQQGTAEARTGLSIQNAGGGVVSWSASTATPWLALGATSGPAPATLQIRVATQGLGLGTHSGSITIAGTNGAGTVTVPVNVVVVRSLRQVRLPQISR